MTQIVAGSRLARVFPLCRTEADVVRHGVCLYRVAQEIIMQTQKSRTDGRATPAAIGVDAPASDGAAAPDYSDRSAMLEKYAPLVKMIVSRMRGKMPQHADVEELESAGMTGLLSAIERYDPSRGYSFQTYASVRIRGSILDELRHMDMVPRSVRIKQRLIARTTQTLEQRLGRAPTDGELSGELSMDAESFRRFRAQTRPVSIVYLDSDNQGEGGALHESIADENGEEAHSRIEREELQELIARRILEMPEQSRKVLALYFNEGMRLAEIGLAMGLSEARICQIRSQAIEQLRRYVQRMSTL